MKKIRFYKRLHTCSPKPSTMLHDPEGTLSKMIPSSTIEAVNKSLEKVIVNVGAPESVGGMSTDEVCKVSANGKKQAHYIHYSAKDKGTIGNYAIQHGTAAAIKHFKPQYSAPKWSTMND